MRILLSRSVMSDSQGGERMQPAGGETMLKTDDVLSADASFFDRLTPNT